MRLAAFAVLIAAARSVAASPTPTLSLTLLNDVATNVKALDHTSEYTDWDRFVRLSSKQLTSPLSEFEHQTLRSLRKQFKRGKGFYSLHEPVPRPAQVTTQRTLSEEADEELDRIAVANPGARGKSIDPESSFRTPPEEGRLAWNDIHEFHESMTSRSSSQSSSSGELTIKWADQHGKPLKKVFERTPTVMTEGQPAAHVEPPSSSLKDHSLTTSSTRTSGSLASRILANVKKHKWPIAITAGSIAGGTSGGLTYAFVVCREHPHAPACYTAKGEVNSDKHKTSTSKETAAGSKQIMF